MPSGKNWVNFLYVNISFSIYITAIFYFNQMNQIKANWPLYRCNPMYMFLADDIDENFGYCIQTMQSGFMGHLLEPLTHVTDLLTFNLGGLMEDIQNIRVMFNNVRTFLANIIESVFGIFLNLIIEFQKISNGIKDLMGKTIGIMSTLTNTMNGSIMTANSMWAGPTGQIVRSLGKCFHPLTNINLKNNTIKYMKDIELGDILEDGSVVESVLKINNSEKIPFYSIENTDEPILVTGSHLVYDDSIKQFIQVKDYKKAIPTNITYDWFSCLITNTHLIKIGKTIFWDWEDHFVKVRQ